MPDKEKETDMQHEILIRAAQLLLEQENGDEKTAVAVEKNEDGTLTVDGVTFQRKDPEKVEAVEPEPEKKRFGVPAILHEESKRDLKEFRISAAIKGIAGLGWDKAGLEREWVRMGRSGQVAHLSGSIDKAVLETGDDSAGGFLVPAETASGIIEYLYAKSLFRKAGAVVLPNSPQTYLLNKVTGTTTGYWIGKGAQTSAITESEPSYGQIRMDLKRQQPSAVLQRVGRGTCPRGHRPRARPAGGLGVLRWDRRKPADWPPLLGGHRVELHHVERWRAGFRRPV